VTFEILNGEAEGIFEEDSHSTAYTLKWKNLWELSDALTFEWGLSGLNYKDSNTDAGVADEITTLSGTDFTFKWRPTAKGRYQAFIWSTEFIHLEKEGSNANRNAGYMTFIRYQFAERWYAQYRHEQMGLAELAEDAVDETKTDAILLAFIPSEFSAIRLQVEKIDYELVDEDEMRAMLQLNISIGAHPAHMY
jgi:hypothetical protein